MKNKLIMRNTAILGPEGHMR